MTRRNETQFNTFSQCNSIVAPLNVHFEWFIHALENGKTVESAGTIVGQNCEGRPKYGKNGESFGKKHKRIDVCLWLNCSVCTNLVDSTSCIYGGYCVHIIHIRALALADLDQVLRMCYKKLCSMALFYTHLFQIYPCSLVWCLEFGTIIYIFKNINKNFFFINWCRLTFNSRNILFMPSIFTNSKIRTSNDSG